MTRAKGIVRRLLAPLGFIPEVILFGVVIYLGVRFTVRDLYVATRYVFYPPTMPVAAACAVALIVKLVQRRRMWVAVMSGMALAAIAYCVLTDEFHFARPHANPGNTAKALTVVTWNIQGGQAGWDRVSERIKRDDDRIDIQADTTERGESFVVKLDDSAGVQDNSSIGHGAWRLVYPPEEQASLAAQAGVQAWLQGWQAAYGGADPGDTDSGIFAWVDMDSAVDFVILQEFMKNNDAYYLSVHLWKDVDGVMYFTPWDMDLTLGQPLYNDNSLSNEWILYRPTMIDGMTAVGAFGEALQARWWELRQGLLAEDTLLQRLDGYRALMGDVVYENFQVWPIEDIQFSGDQLPVVASFDEEWERVRVWISERLAWVDDNISEY